MWLALPGSITLHLPAASAAEETAGVPPLAQVQTAYLDYQEVNYTFLSWNIPIVVRSPAFKKEPAWGPNRVFRGTFLFGGGDSNAVAFAWNQTAAKLYVDLNRNLDLTDDVSGVFGAPESRTPRYANFTNVHLTLKTPSGERPCLVDLNLWYSGKWRHCRAELRSLWQGKLVLNNEEWQVGIVENFADQRFGPASPFLLLRPWKERNNPFNTYSGSQVAFRFPPTLFVPPHAYRLEYTNEPPGDNSRLSLRFTEQQPALGKLKINSAFIQRILLEGGPYTVVMDKPEGVAAIPSGTYRQLKLFLKKDDAEAYHDSLRAQPGWKITIDEKKLAALTAGWPLTNSVSIARHGKQLNLNYRLVGAGGEIYQLMRQDRDHPPEFGVFQAGKKIASGKFEFG